jgi:hypothetical protein
MGVSQKRLSAGAVRWPDAPAAGPHCRTPSEADRIFAALQQAAVADLRELANLLAAKDDSNAFRATEFTVRDIALRVGAKAIQTTLEERKKGVRRLRPGTAVRLINNGVYRRLRYTSQPGLSR